MINVKISGDKKIIRDLIISRSKLLVNTRRFINELAYYGKGVAELGFIGVEEPTTHNDVQVYLVEEGEVHQIVAEGSAVLFIEFGTGKDADHPLGQQLGFVIDSWSSTHKKVFHKLGYWVWDGVQYTGTESHQGMYNASKAMRRRLKSLVKEVYK